MEGNFTILLLQNRLGSREYPGRCIVEDETRVESNRSKHSRENGVGSQGVGGTTMHRRRLSRR